MIGVPRLPPLGLRSSLLLLCAALSGCAPSVELARPKLALPNRFEAAPDAATSETLDRWWDRFADPQLSALVDEALAYSTDTRSAYFRLREARAIRDQSLSQRLPTGSISGSAKVQDGSQLSGVDLLGSTTRSFMIRSSKQ